MAINLKKGGSINLSKSMTKLNKLMIGLGWEYASIPVDLDASVFILGANGKLLSDEYFIFYNNLKAPDGSVQHTGDNRTGSDNDDDEVILANLDNIHPNATEICICVTIHQAQLRNHTFGMLREAYIRIVDMDTKAEVVNYDLDSSHNAENSLVFARIKKSGNEWYFYADSLGSTSELQALVDMFV